MNKTAGLILKEQRLEKELARLGSVIVAYSGGVDSSLLAYYARKVLGEKARIVIALSASLATEELAAARQQAQLFGWDLIEIETDELNNADYARNDQLRCYYCKKTLFTELETMAASENIKNIAYGANMDDRGDYRPGHKAAQEFAIVSPLQDAELDKADIRSLAQKASLPSWDRPQAACLSSRFPTFEPITLQGLETVDKAEQYLHSLGFRQVRVRHYGNLAKIEIDTEELDRVNNNMKLRNSIEKHMKSLGFEEVFIDPAGYRQGSSNIFLKQNG